VFTSLCLLSEREEERGRETEEEGCWGLERGVYYVIFMVVFHLFPTGSRDSKRD
jgi:hypothetical protein